MKQWFRPTGGFGIGMQSAFLITDKVEIFTQAKNSPGYQITLSQKDKSNNSRMWAASSNARNQGRAYNRVCKVRCR